MSDDLIRPYGTGLRSIPFRIEKRSRGLPGGHLQQATFWERALCDGRSG